MTAALPATIRTDRFVGERCDERHLDDLARLYAEPAVTDWFGGGATRDEVREWLATTVRSHWDEHGFGLYAFYEATGTTEHGGDRVVGAGSASCADAGRAPRAAFVGRAGLKVAAADVREQLGEPEAVELLYGLMPGQWGRGYATEIGRALAGLALGRLGLESVIAYTLPENARSRRVLEKCGFTEDGDVVHEGLPHVLYRRRRD